MPPQTQTSSIFQKIANEARAAHAKHKNDETEYSSFGELPDGIEGGIAELKEIGFKVIGEGKENAGKVMFVATGVVKMPKEHGGRRCEGLRTTVMENLYDTPGKAREGFEEHWSWMLNQVRMLGVDTARIPEANAAQVLEQTVFPAMAKAGIHFSFRTWKGAATPAFPNPRVNSQWVGKCEAPADDGEGSASYTADPNAAKAPSSSPTAAPSKNGAATPPAAPKAPTATAKAPPSRTSLPKKAAPTPEPALPFDDQGDIDSLVQRAENEEEAARDRLTDMAIKAGYTQAEIDEAPNWAALSEMILAPREEGTTTATEEAAEETTEEWVPEVGNVVMYKPINPKTKQPAKDAVECEIVVVNPTNQTANLKNLDKPGVIYTQVKWDRIEGGTE